MNLWFTGFSLIWSMLGAATEPPTDGENFKGRAVRYGRTLQLVLLHFSR